MANWSVASASAKVVLPQPGGPCSYKRHYVQLISVGHSDRLHMSLEWSPECHRYHCCQTQLHAANIRLQMTVAAQPVDHNCRVTSLIEIMSVREQMGALLGMRICAWPFRCYRPTALLTAERKESSTRGSNVPFNSASERPALLFCCDERYISVQFIFLL